MNPLLLCDFYKVGHRDQYPKGITQVWSNWTPRSSRIPNATHVVPFGMNYFIKRYLIENFQDEFFKRPASAAIGEYRDVVHSALGVDPKVDHIKQLHDLGYLPIELYALPEGSRVPLNVPAAIITNTHPDFFWLPNYFETLLSNILWKPSTTATMARTYREIFLKYAKQAGERDLGFIDWMGHDFSFRGMSGLEDAILSGMAHLTSFSGTDTIPAIMASQRYYRASSNVGGSVPATEHSVMSAGSQEGEFETFRRLITEVYPGGIVSIVSDTWDLWKVLTDYIPRLRDTILSRPGKIVIRPDSGDPVKIMCGSDGQHDCGPSSEGVMRLLADALGTYQGSGNLKLINNAGAIYGDSITPERADAILSRLVLMGFSPYNMVFGIGSYTYQYCTRDTHGWAMKATAIRIGNAVLPIFKKPVTDDGGKFSHRGILAVYGKSGAYTLKQEATEGDLNDCAFDLVYSDGTHLVDPRFDEIRNRVRQF